MLAHLGMLQRTVGTPLREQLELTSVHSWAKYQPYSLLRQRFWRQYLKQYDTDDTVSISHVEITSMLDLLGSTLTGSTVDSFFTRFGKDPQRDDLTIEEAIRCLETEVMRPESERRRVDGDSSGIGASLSPSPAPGQATPGEPRLAELDFAGPALEVDFSGEGRGFVTKPSEMPYLKPSMPTHASESSSDADLEEVESSSSASGSSPVSTSASPNASLLTPSASAPMTAPSAGKKTCFRRPRYRKTQSSSVTTASTIAPWSKACVRPPASPASPSSPSPSPCLCRSRRLPRILRTGRPPLVLASRARTSSTRNTFKSNNGNNTTYQQAQPWLFNGGAGPRAAWTRTRTQGLGVRQGVGAKTAMATQRSTMRARGGIYLPPPLWSLPSSTMLVSHISGWAVGRAVAVRARITPPPRLCAHDPVENTITRLLYLIGTKTATCVSSRRRRTPHSRPSSPSLRSVGHLDPTWSIRDEVLRLAAQSLAQAKKIRVLEEAQQRQRDAHCEAIKNLRRQMEADHGDLVDHHKCLKQRYDRLLEHCIRAHHIRPQATVSIADIPEAVAHHAGHHNRAHMRDSEEVPSIEEHVETASDLQGFSDRIEVWTRGNYHSHLSFCPPRTMPNPIDEYDESDEENVLQPIDFDGASRQDLVEALKSYQLSATRLLAENRKLRKENSNLLAASSKKRRKNMQDDNHSGYKTEIVGLAKRFLFTRALFLSRRSFQRERPQRPENPRDQFTSDAAYINSMAITLFEEVPPFIAEHGDGRSSLLTVLRKAMPTILKEFGMVKDDILSVARADRSKDPVLAGLLKFPGQRKPTCFAPILFPGGVQNMTEVFTGPVVLKVGVIAISNFMNIDPVKVHRVMLFGPNSLHEKAKPAANCNGIKLGVKVVTSSSLSAAALLSRFLVSPDKEWASTGAISGINWEADYRAYLELLEYNRHQPHVKRIFKKMHEFVFAGVDLSTDTNAEQSDSELEAVNDAMRRFELGTDTITDVDVDEEDHDPAPTANAVFHVMPSATVEQPAQELDQHRDDSPELLQVAPETATEMEAEETSRGTVVAGSIPTCTPHF
ncbi:hypothetical protein B0H15DRAFT_933866 [Mycena belliarum]|uniref:Uncharacterized protein n=1 Tax=Mycena belliarum TaxID=1033014 RepID=A0AAD6XGU7_9AGAR|nr:hypothetical protein B0H15DRAFT_933866 [Mycena belliae]